MQTKPTPAITHPSRQIRRSSIGIQRLRPLASCATIAALALALPALQGCATARGVPYVEHAASLPKLTATASRVTFYRPATVQSAGMETTLRVDGDVAGVLGADGATVFDLAPGAHVLSTSGTHWVRAECELSVNLEPGGENYFRVEPRFMNALAIFAYGPVGDAVEASGKRCGGAFKLERVDAAVAVPALKGLKMTVQGGK